MPTAVEFILRIDGIAADSSNDHKGGIAVLSFSWGVSVDETGRKAGFQDLVVTKHVDRTTPSLMLACSSGKHFKAATFEVIAMDDAGMPVGNTMLLKIEDVSVDSVRMMGHENGGDFPTEEVSLNASKVSTLTLVPAVRTG
jgi:type VI secretion system secreted protein Hcp